MDSFTHTQPGSRVVFGVDALSRLPAEMALLGKSRALVISTSGQQAQARAIAHQLGLSCVGVFSDAIMHVPIGVVSKACEQAKLVNADCLIAYGGGSSIGLAKGVALQTGIPIIAVPTTYAGSEQTAIFGITDGGVKKTGRDARVLPKTVLYDPTLTLMLPQAISMTSGMNAMAHAIGGMIARNTNPLTCVMAEEGIRALSAGLQKLSQNLRDLDARGDCLVGAWLCGAVLGAADMSLHHKLCHTLGGTWNLAHADTHCALLPHTTAYNEKFVPEAMKRVGRALGVTDVPEALFDLGTRLGTPSSLKDLGMPETDLDHAAEMASLDPYWNPRQVDRIELRVLLDNAFHGRKPDAH